MSDPTHDDELLASLAAAIDRAVGDVPADLTAIARDAGSWMVIDDELAALADAGTMATRAGDQTGTTATFRAPPFEIALILLDETLVGEIVPNPGPHAVVDTASSTRRVDLDALGRFRAAGTAKPYRIRFSAGNRQITTPWVTR